MNKKGRSEIIGRGTEATAYGTSSDFYKVFQEGGDNEWANLKYLALKHVSGVPQVIDWGAMPSYDLWLHLYVKGIANAQSIIITNGDSSGFSNIWKHRTFPQRIKAVAAAAVILRDAHEVGVSHNDVKPENIVVDVKGNVRVIDWNAATTFGWKLFVDGTRGFKAPGFMRRDKSDVFGLGETIFVSILKPMEGTEEANGKLAIVLTIFYKAMVNRNADKQPSMEETVQYLEYLAQWAANPTTELKEWHPSVNLVKTNKMEAVKKAVVSRITRLLGRRNDSAMSTELISVNEAEAEKILNRVVIHDQVDGERDPLLKRLERDDISRLGMLPKYKVEAGSRTIYFSTPYYLGSKRLAILGYVQDGDVFVSRTYYISGSEAQWRFLPRVRLGKDGKIEWYDKGYSEYSLRLPHQLQKVLAEMQDKEKLLTLNEADQQLLFAGTTNREARTYMGVMDPIPQEVIFQHGAVAKGLSIPPELLEFSNGDKPDLDRLIDSYTFNSLVYGRVTARIFKSYDDKYIFTFMQDRKGRCWIAMETNGSDDLTSLGLKAHWVNGGQFVVPAFEYPDQSGNYGNFKLVVHVDGSDEILYVDMSKNYLSKIPIIKEFQERFSDNLEVERKYIPIIESTLGVQEPQIGNILPTRIKTVHHWNGKQPVTIKLGHTLVQIKKDEEGYYAVRFDKSGLELSNRLYFENSLDLGRQNKILQDLDDPGIAELHLRLMIDKDVLNMVNIGTTESTYYVVGELTSKILNDLAMVNSNPEQAAGKSQAMISAGFAKTDQPFAEWVQKLPDQRLSLLDKMQVQALNRMIKRNRLEKMGRIRKVLIQATKASNGITGKKRLESVFTRELLFLTTVNVKIPVPNVKQVRSIVALRSYLFGSKDGSEAWKRLVDMYHQLSIDTGEPYFDTFPEKLNRMLVGNNYRYLAPKSAATLLDRVRLHHFDPQASLPYSLMSLRPDLSYYREYSENGNRIAKVIFFSRSSYTVIDTTEFYFVNGEYVGYGHAQLPYHDKESMKENKFDRLQLLYHVFGSHRNLGLSDKIFEVRMKELAVLLPEDGQFEILNDQFNKEPSAIRLYTNSTLGFRPKNPEFDKALKDYKLLGIISQGEFLKIIKEEKFKGLFTSSLVKPVRDEAVLARQAPGGIDLTSKRMKLEVDSDKAVVSQPMDLKALENIEINGLYIKDIEIKPLKNLPELLGVSAG